MSAFIDAHVHPPLAEFLDGPIASLPTGGVGRGGAEPTAMEAVRVAEIYRAQDARAVVYGWDSEWTTNRRPFGSTDVAALVATDPETFVGLGAVDPLKGAAAVGQVHEAARLGLAGIAFHPQAQGFDPADRITNQVWEAAAGHDLICAFHTGSTLFGAGTPGGSGLRLERGRPIKVDPIAARFEGLRIVLVHGGSLWLDEAVAVAKHKANVYLCLGGQSPGSLSEDVLEAISGPLADRVVFGSGFPFADPGEWIRKWAKLGMPRDLTDNLLGNSAAGLFGFPSA